MSVSPRPPSPTVSPSLLFALALLLLTAIGVCYRTGLDGPFVFDDVPAIVENPSIRSVGTAWTPPSDRGLPVTGRPLVNVSFALNYTWSGLAPRAYRMTNIALHAAAALLFFGLVRRTFARLPGASPNGNTHAWLAAAVALLWATHPLNTAAVTYISQRSEVGVAVFYLLTLYAFIRGATSELRLRIAWFVVAAMACAAGMATKEVMVSAPLVVLLYDAVFLSAGFFAAWRARWMLHLGVMATWLVLAGLMLSTGSRAGTAGFNLGITPWAYALKQCDAITHYLRLALWPDPLVFDYGGMVLLAHATEAIAPGLVLIVLIVATGVALFRRSATGFLGITFFLILAPTSSVVPVADTMFEHRMYLPLAAVIAGSVGALRSIQGDGLRTAFGCTLAAIALGCLTSERNAIYRSELTLWGDTVAKRPASTRAHYTYGSVLATDGRTAEALAEYRRALELSPASAPAHSNLGNLLTRSGRAAEAVPHYEAALQSEESADTHNNFGNALQQLGRVREARAHYETALRLRPASADAHNNLGSLLAQTGDWSGAKSHFEAVLRSRPDFADAHANLGNVLAQAGRPAEALAHYDAALQLRPDFPTARMNFAQALVDLRRWPEAIAHYHAVLRAAPGYPGAREALAKAELAQEILGK